MSALRYTQTNPWITFQDQVTLNPLWCHLGEAYSKTQHLAGTPLQPGLARNLSSVYLIKGAVATTAIEGNTLNEEEAAAVLDGTSKLPPSQQYLEQEIRNVLAALGAISHSATQPGTKFTVTTEWIKAQNELVLRGLEVEDHVVPGEYTERQLVVANYRAAPPEDVEYLMDRLVTWPNEWLEPVHGEEMPSHQKFFNAFLAAVLSHLYIAWIHPFGDGNGRTARLLECAILAHSGVVPWVSSNLLSDHYKRTRSRYYLRLQSASRDNDVDAFIRYAAEGYVDMLREQIRTVQDMQRATAWVNYVHHAFHDEPSGTALKRRRDVALKISEKEPVTRRGIRLLSPWIAAMYAGKEDKTVSRDINKLIELNLIRRVAGGYVSNIRLIDAFKPLPDQS